MSANAIKVEIAPGELVDKITILRIKSERMDDPVKLKNVNLELAILEATHNDGLEPSDKLAELTGRLKEINERLWEIEDDIRDCEAARDFGDTFIKLARAVYQTNDERARLKRDINLLLGSEIIEEKSYKPY